MQSLVPRRSLRLASVSDPGDDTLRPDESDPIPPPPRLVRQNANEESTVAGAPFPYAAGPASDPVLSPASPHATIRFPFGTRFLQMRFASSMNQGMFNVVEMALRDVPGSAPVAEHFRVYSVSSEEVERASRPSSQGLTESEMERAVRVRARGRETRARKRARQTAATERCAICLDPMDDEIADLPCNHAFHAECIRNWLREKPTCACCRADVRG